MSILDYSRFRAQSDEQKAVFIEEFLEGDSYLNSNPQLVKSLLQNIIIHESNSYVREQAMMVYSGLVIISRLKAPSFIGLLTEDISDDAPIFVQIKRLRLLFLHFDFSNEAIEVFDRLSYHYNADVASEALYKKGLLSFLALSGAAERDFLSGLKECRTKFDQASITSENRGDAQYYSAVCNLLLDLISNNEIAIANSLEECLTKLWQLRFYSDNVAAFQLEYQIGLSLVSLVNLFAKAVAQPSWIDYQRELNEVFELHQRFIAADIEGSSMDRAIITAFKAQISAHIVTPLFQTNLAACLSKIQVLLAKDLDVDLHQFLKTLHDELKGSVNKKKDGGQLLALLARQFPNIPSDEVIDDLSKVDLTSTPDIVALIAGYAGRNTDRSITGYPQGDEIFHKLFTDIKSAIPAYPKAKLLSFGTVLSSVIIYVLRTMQDKREFFPELYDSRLANGRTEHIFQESLYRNLRQSREGANYLYEPNQAGGGRIDITYNDGRVMFPIEVKKTTTLPTWSAIRSDYLAQAQTYANSYDQLGLFIVFDLTPKNDQNRPINDVRELFKLQALQAHLDLGKTYPDEVVCVIVPANKVSPSSMSTYR